MSYEEAMVPRTVPANADLSAYARRFVAINSSGKLVLNTTAGARCYGVLYDKPAAVDRAACVIVGGVVPVVASATIQPGDKIASTNDGRAAVATTGQHYMGIAKEGGASGAFIPVDLSVQGVAA